MTKYHFLGTDTILGRFGPVTRGDVLHLTDKEAESVQDDKRFKLWSATAKILKTKLALPDGFDELTEGEQKKVLKQLEQAEAARLDKLAQANAATATVALDELSRDELIDLAGKLRAEGKTVDFQKDASRAAIRDAIALTMGQDRDTEENDEGDDEGAIPPGGKAAGSPTGEGTGGAPITRLPVTGTAAPEGDGKGTGEDTGKAGAESNQPPAIVARPAIALPDGLEELTQPELDAEIAKLEAAGRPVKPATGKRVDKIAAIKAACEEIKAPQA